MRARVRGVDFHLYNACPSTRRTPRPSEPRGGAQKAGQPVYDMAKERAGMTEETQYMMDRIVTKEPENVPTSGDAKEMRAVVLAGFGGLNKLRVTKKPMPEPQDGEVKIRVKAW